MPFEDAIQLSESIEYPDGDNAITIEGTGDEGGVASFAEVSLVVTPGVITADGIKSFMCTATVYDPSNPTATVVSLRSEETTADTPITVSTNMLIKRFIGLWYNVGGAKGADITSYVSAEGVKRDHVVLNTELATPDVIIDYEGNSAVNFGTNAPLVSILHEDDPTWSLPTISGEFRPYSDVMVDGVYDQPAVVTLYFVPENGQMGDGYITASFGNGFDTQSIVVNPAPIATEISVTAEPSSIDPFAESVITAVVTVGGIPITSGRINFQFYYRGELGQLSSPSADIVVTNNTEELSSSYDFDKLQSTIQLGANAIQIVSVIAADGTNYTSTVDYIDSDDSTLVYMSPQFPLEIIPITVEYTRTGSASVMFKSNGKTSERSEGNDDPVLISASYGGRDNMASVSIPAGGSGAESGALSITPTPSSLPERTGTLPPHDDIKPPVNGQSLLTIESTSSASVDVKITHGEGTLSKSVVSMTTPYDFTEEVTPSDVTHLSVAHVVDNIVSMTHYGAPVSAASYTGKEITLSTPLVDLENVIVVYKGIQVAELYYTPPLFWNGAVHVSATQQLNMASCEILVGTGGAAGLTIAVAASPASIMSTFSSTITATLTEGPEGAKTPVADTWVDFSLSPTPPNRSVLSSMGLRENTLTAPYGPTASALTDVDGNAKVVYKGANTGIETIIARTIDDGTGTCQVTVTELDNTNRYTYVLEMIFFELEILNQTLMDGGGAQPYFHTLVSPRNTGMVSFLMKKYMPIVGISNPGILHDMDQWGGIDVDPLSEDALLTLSCFLPFIPIGFSSYSWDISLTGTSGAQLVDFTGAPLKIDEGALQFPNVNSTLNMQIRVPSEENKKVETKTPVTTPAGDPIKGKEGNIEIAGQNKPINPVTGEATHVDLPPGTHKVTINVDGYFSNQPPTVYSPYVYWDANPANKEVRLAQRSTRPFKLKASTLGVKGLVTINSSQKHSWATGGSSGSYGYSVVSVKDNMLGITLGKGAPA